MDDLLNHPAVQAGVLPFVAALAVAALLRNTRQLGLAIVAGFLCAVGLTMGFGFESLTSMRKLVLVGIGAAVAGALLERLPGPRLAHRAAMAAAMCLATLWVLQRLLLQREPAALVLAAVGAAAYLASLLAGADRVRRDTVCAAATALVLGLSSGALALLGASAQLAQLGIALGASAGAVLLVQMPGSASSPVGWTLGLAAQVIAGLVGLLAVFTGSLPWYCLMPLPLVAWAAHRAPRQGLPVWKRAVLAVLFGLGPALVAIAFAWFMAGEPAA